MIDAREMIDYTVEEAMGKKKTDISETLREAIVDSGISFRQLEKRTGLQRASITRFVHEERDLYLWSAALLAEELGLELQSKKRGRK